MWRIAVVAGCAFALAGLSSEAAWAQQPQETKQSDVKKSAVAESSHVLTSRDADAKTKIRAKLEQPTKMDFTETQLSDVVSYLKDYHHIEIQLDLKALENASIGSETPITRQLEGIPLRSALRLMLGALDLTYVVGDGVLLITTPEAAAKLVVTKIYPVGDLLLHREGGCKPDDFKALTQAIRSTISPGSWTLAGGLGDIASLPEARALVVMQTDEGQEDVAKLLASLRKVRDIDPRQLSALDARRAAEFEEAIARSAAEATAQAANARDAGAERKVSETAAAKDEDAMPEEEAVGGEEDNNPFNR